MKGNAGCEKLMLKRDPLEQILLGVIQDRLQLLVTGEGEALLRRYVAEEIAAQGVDPRREVAQHRARLAELENKASVLLDTVSPETKDFVDAKLRELATEKHRLTARLEELETVSFKPIDADTVVREGLASLRNLPRLLEHGSLEERKLFVRAFLTNVTIQPERAEIEVHIRQFPALVGAGNSTCEMVAGGRFPGWTRSRCWLRGARLRLALATVQPYFVVFAPALLLSVATHRCRQKRLLPPRRLKSRSRPVVPKARLETNAGAVAAVGEVELWRTAPPPEELLGRRPWRADLTRFLRVEAQVPREKTGSKWMVGPAVGVGRGGISYGAVAAGPPLRVGRVEVRPWIGALAGCREPIGVLGVLFDW